MRNAEFIPCLTRIPVIDHEKAAALSQAQPALPQNCADCPQTRLSLCFTSSSACSDPKTTPRPLPLSSHFCHYALT